MTEKVFHAKIDEFGAYYSVCENQKIVGETVDEYDAVRIVKRLNELYDENKNLVEEIRRLEENNAEVHDMNHHLSKIMIHQLDEINKLYEQINTMKGGFDEGNEIIGELRKENEQLKQRLVELDDTKWLRENTVWEQMPTRQTSKTRVER